MPGGVYFVIQIGKYHRFGQKGKRPFIHRLDGPIHIGESGNDNHRHGMPMRRLQNLETGGLGHLNIRNDQIHGLRIQRQDRLLPVARQKASVASKIDIAL